MHDDELVQLVATGDHDAFAVLYERWKLRLMSFLRWRLGIRRWHEADSIAAEAWSKVWTNSSSYRPECFWSWLKQIARHCVVDKYRSERSLPTRHSDLDEHFVPMHDMIEASVAPTDHADQEFIKLRFQAVITAMQKIAPPEQREVIMLFSDGLSLADIAKKLDCKHSTIKSRFRLAKEKLMLQLAWDRKSNPLPF